MNPAPPAPRKPNVLPNMVMALANDDEESWARGLARDLIDARQQLAELEATIANDQGRGEPPSPGWRFVVDDALHGRWEHPERLGMVQRTMVRGWYWTDWDHSFHPDRVKATAREAMRAADAARGPG